MSTTSFEVPGQPQEEPEHEKQEQAGSEPMRAAKRPVAAGFLSVLGVIWSLLLIALAVVCVRDALVGFGTLSGEPWINSVTDSLDGTFATNWMHVIGGVCIVVGLLLLAAALRPRPRRGIKIEADTSVLVSASAVRRVASSAAGDVDGVDTVSVSASRTRVTVDATILTSAQVDEVKANISEAVSDRLSALRDSPQVRVRAKSIGGDQ